MDRLKQWAHDWLGLADVKSSNSKIEDPIAIVQRVFAALAAIAAVLSSPAIGVLAPNLNANAALVLRALVVAVTLIAVHYVVTAKDVTETTTGFRSVTLRTYRFSTTERLIARGVVVLALVMLALNLVPAPAAPRDCNLTATVDWPVTDGARTPLYLSMTAGSPVRYPLEQARPIVMQVPAAHVSTFSMILVWSDGFQSDFGAFSGCAAVRDRRSGDGRAKVDLAIR